MNRIRTTLLIEFAALALQACAGTTSDNSSGSNWLKCTTDDDCRAAGAAQCGPQGYCLDSHGERVPLAGTDASPAHTRAPDASPHVGTDASPAHTHSGDAAVRADAGGPRAVDSGGPSTVDSGPSTVDSGGPRRWTSACDAPGARDPLTERTGETCYTFALHGASSVTDDSAFSVQTGESFNQFYYAVPWPSGTVATAYGVVSDSGSPALRAWLFTTSSNWAPGTVSPNVSGTLLGENAGLLGAWAAGGCNAVFPDSVGLELPSSGLLVVQWHHENESGSAKNDKSAFRVCTAPAATREQRVAMTWLGTEDFHGSGPPAGTSQFGGSCVNNSGAPVAILSLSPYMHRVGARMTTVIQRATGAKEVLLDAPFHFEAPETYTLTPPAVLEPGDSIRSTCSFDNTTGSTVLAGTSSHQEVCFQFATGYPAGALNNGVISLVGATNTCW